MHSSIEIRRFFLAQVNLEGEGEKQLLIAVRGRISGEKVCEIVLKSFLPPVNCRLFPPGPPSVALLRTISERDFDAARGAQVIFDLIPQIEFWSLKT